MKHAMHKMKVLALALMLLSCCSVRGRGADASITFETPAADSQSSSTIVLNGQDSSWQLQVTARDHRQTTRDVTRQVRYQVDPAHIATVDESGFLRPLATGSASVVAVFEEGVSAQVNIVVRGLDAIQPVNFAHQIIPIFTKLGCNSGGCHGKAAGQAGFKLSLLGFEPQEDYEHLLNESRGRRLFPALPDKSLLLQKATNMSPHGGGKRMDVDSHEYRLLRRWVASGMPFGEDHDPQLTNIRVIPAQALLEREQWQQLSVVATYSDGSTEDVTRTAQYESNNTDMAEVTESGLVKLGIASGNSAIMTRYQGQVAVFRIGVPLGVNVAQWPASNNLVDELVFAKLKALGIPPSTPCDDATWIRRVTLDLCGRLPTAQEAQAFLSDSSPKKFETTVDHLLASSDHAEFFAKKWSSILRNRRNSTGHQFGSFSFYAWLRDSFYRNQPYDQLVRELLTATGSIESNPPVAWFREVSSTEARIEDVSQLFLGQRLQCARCHHHPYEKWSQTDYYHMSAFFSKVSRKDGDTPEEPHFVSRAGAASAKHPKSGQDLPPASLDSQPSLLGPIDDPRTHLVDWMVSPDNPYFARSLSNRYWKHFFAVGLVEPEDDMRVTNPPSHSELLDGLSDYFVDTGFDQRALMRLICTSTTYRLSSNANAHNLADKSYSRFYPKRLQAEVLLDAVDQVLLTETAFDGLPLGTRAVSLPDTQFSSYFLDVFGKPESTTACECERSQEATLAQSLHLLNSKEVQAKLSSDSSLPASLAASSESTEKRIEQLYLSALSRFPTASEVQTASDYLLSKSAQPRLAFEDLVWAVLNSKEFIFNH